MESIDKVLSSDSSSEDASLGDSLTSSRVGLNGSDDSGMETPDFIHQKSFFASESENGNGKTLDQVHKKVLNGGYSKKGEVATEEDAVNLGLDPEDASKIYICNREGNLAMFHFRDEYNKSLDDGEDHKKITSVRGWIMDINTNQVLCKSFTEGSVFFTDSKEMHEMDWTGYRFSTFLEGATIRVFHDGREWQYSTHRKIDCHGSRIPGVEIEVFKIFQDSWPEFDESILNKNLIYVFQVVHRDNQIMNPDPVVESRVYHLATISSSFSEEPFKLLSYGADDPRYRLTGAHYTDSMNLEFACENYISKNKSIIAYKGFEITQIASHAMAKLMEVRGCDQAPYIPAELMYLRLSPADRPLLIDAVPYHLREKVSVERMTEYIETNVVRLSQFCAQTLLAKISGVQILLTKTLTWLLRRVLLDKQTISMNEIAGEYERIIRPMISDNGVSLYRCFRDIDVVNNKMKKVGVIQTEPSDEMRFTHNNAPKSNNNSAPYKKAVLSKKNQSNRNKKTQNKRATKKSPDTDRKEKGTTVMDILSEF